MSRVRRVVRKVGLEGMVVFDKVLFWKEVGW